jgi:hypothetical protein
MAILQYYDVNTKGNEFKLMLPKDSQPITFFKEDGYSKMAILADPDAPSREPRWFICHIKGDEVDTTRTRRYIGTAEFEGTAIHLFELDAKKVEEEKKKP